MNLTSNALRGLASSMVILISEMYVGEAGLRWSECWVQADGPLALRCNWKFAGYAVPCVHFTGFLPFPIALTCYNAGNYDHSPPQNQIFSMKNFDILLDSRWSGNADIASWLRLSGFHWPISSSSLTCRICRNSPPLTVHIITSGGRNAASRISCVIILSVCCHQVLSTPAATCQHLPPPGPVNTWKKKL